MTTIDSESLARLSPRPEGTEASKRLLDDIVQEHRSKFINTGFIF